MKWGNTNGKTKKKVRFLDPSSVEGRKKKKMTNTLHQKEKKTTGLPRKTAKKKEKTKEGLQLAPEPGKQYRSQRLTGAEGTTLL